MAALRVVLGQRLLRGADDPDLAAAEILQILRQTLQIEDLGLLAADILADLVDDEDDVLLARRLADDVDHLLHAVVHQIDDVAARRREGLLGPEQVRVELVREPRDHAVDDQLVVSGSLAHASPVSSRNACSNSA